MQPLFNFLSIRPVDIQSFRGATLSTESDFQQRLAIAPASPDPRSTAYAAASKFLESHQAVQDPARVPQAPNLLDALDRALGKEILRAAELRRIFTDTLGPLPDLVRSADYIELLQKLRDSMVAVYITGAPGRSLERLVRAALVADAAGNEGLSDEQVEALLRGPLELPAFVDQLQGAKPAPPAPPKDPALEAGRIEKEVEDLHRQLLDLQRARTDLSLVQMDELLVDDSGMTRPLITLFTEHLHKVVAPHEQRRVKVQPKAESTLMSRVGADYNVIMSSKAIETLPVKTLRALRALNIDLGSTPLRELNIAIDDQIHSLIHDLQKFTLTYDFKAKPIPSLDISKWILDPLDDPEPEDTPWIPARPQLPVTKGTAKPLGVADLLLVKSQLLRYERAGVAQLESLLPGSKLTLNQRDSRTEEITLTEEAEQTSFESEARHLSESLSGSSSRPVSQGYGPVNEGKDSAEFAQNITRDAARNTSARSRRQHTRRTLVEHEERRELVLDTPINIPARHAVYQWLDQVHQAQVFNYGQRLLYDLIVPEPAALFAQAIARQSAGALPLVRPAVFRTDPANINEWNWTYYAAGHGASGVEPPPAASIVLAEVFADKCANAFSNDLSVSSIFKGEARPVRIPKGYAAKKARVRIASSMWNPGTLVVTVGTRAFHFDQGYQENTLGGEMESIPVGIVVDNDGQRPAYTELAVSIEIVCERTEDAFCAWQAKTHGAIIEANKRRLRDYEERRAYRDASARLALQSLDAQRKKRIVMAEIKRSALSILTGQDFSGFNAITTDGYAFPQPSLLAVDQLSAYIRFFEQAIEWENLGHVCYPYFWGRKSQWIDRIMSDESDPAFAAFLQAGAARVVLPVRPGYEGAMERFMITGLTPTNDELLNVGSPLWVSLVDQLRHRDLAPGDETPVEPAWEIRTPALLTWARPDGSMPRWQLQAGVWVDQADPGF